MAKVARKASVKPPQPGSWQADFNNYMQLALTVALAAHGLRISRDLYLEVAQRSFDRASWWHERAPRRKKRVK